MSAGRFVVFDGRVHLAVRDRTLCGVNTDGSARDEVLPTTLRSVNCTGCGVVVDACKYVKISRGGRLPR